MNRDRLRQLEDIAGLQRLRLERARSHAAALQSELQRAQHACRASESARDGIQAQWRSALERGAGLDLAAIAGWRALAGEAQRRCDEHEAARRQAQDAVDAFARELLRLRIQSERSDEDAARERAALARKREETRADAALERHNATLHRAASPQIPGGMP